jgi:hypothetical protein
LPVELDPQRRPTVAYSARAIGGTDFQARDGGSPLVIGSLAPELSDALVASGQFRTVTPLSADAPSGEPADLQLDFVLVVDANDVILLASACTFFLIPTWRTVEFELVVEARARDGRWKRYVLTDAARDLHWLPLLLGMSFAPWGSAYSGVTANLYRTLLVRLHEDGFLAPVDARGAAAPAPSP